MKTALHVTGMLLLGFAAMTGFAALVEWRVGRPLDVVDVDEGRASKREASPVAALASGLRESITLAARKWGEDRSEAIRALEGALRASKLGTEAVGAPFHEVHSIVAKARRLIENGKAERARDALAGASIEESAKTEIASVPPALEQYEGATVIDRHGVRVGEVAEITEENGRTLIRLAIGGIRDALGFIDIGGRTVSVDPEALLWGKPKGLGSTLVLWAGS